MNSFTATDPVSHKGKTDTWLTPLWLVNALGNFDLDPCAVHGHRTAKNLICLPTNGLEVEWRGRVWLNPPYSQAKIWIEKLSSHRNGVALVFSRTGPFGELMKDCDHLFFLRKRVRFLDINGVQSKKNPGADSMLLAWGNVDFSKLEGSQIK